LAGQAKVSTTPCTTKFRHLHLKPEKKNSLNLRLCNHPAKSDPVSTTCTVLAATPGVQIYKAIPSGLDYKGDIVTDHLKATRYMSAVSVDKTKTSL
jgi:hypothetical protein